MHSFSGSAEMAKELVKLGYMISFSGTVTFKNARKPKEAAAVVPNDRILIETDAPYLAPVPFRGKPNHPALVAHTVMYAAAFLQVPMAQLAAQTTANALRVFDLEA